MRSLEHPLTRPRPWRRAFLLPVVALLAAVTLAQSTWPVEVRNGSDRIEVHEPQPEAIDGNRLSLRSAVAVHQSGQADPVFGTVWVDAVMEMDRTTRLGRITGFTVTDVRFAGLSETEREALGKTLSEQMPVVGPVLSLDHLIAALEREQEGVGEYENTPPEIIYMERPGVLVYVDGEPRYEALERQASKYDDPNHLPPTGKVERVLNTPFVMLRWNGGRHYLFGSSSWFSAETIQGPWSRDYSVPQVVRDVAKQVEEGAELETRAADGSSVAPTIVVRTGPALLIDLDGAPQWRAIPGTGLHYAANTTKDLFRDGSTQQYYLLASGRWFATADLAAGPWRHVPPDKLPADFARIPEGSVKDGVLAHVAGTNAAREAVRDTYVPQTAKVDRRTATLQVQYDGDPWFDVIPGTAVEMAVNASTTVLRIRGRYHALDNAVWYDGPSPHGPWQVSTAVPAEVNTIPPSSPAYNTRYVYIYAHTPEVVYVGYTPGYLGGFVQWGVPIYGTGYYYAPWPRYWRPRPFTWGFHMYYDPWVGWGYNWGWGWTWYYPRWYGWGGHHHWGWGWCGPYGYHPPVVYTNHSYYGHRSSLNSGRTGGTRAADGGVRSSARDLYTGREANGITPARVSRARTEGTGGRTVNATQGASGGRSDYFSDREGNVYRRSGAETERLMNGKWEQVPAADRTGGRDQGRPAATQEQNVGRTAPAPVQQPSAPRTPAPPVQRPSTPHTAPAPQDIQRDRERGRQREQGYEQYQQRPSTPPPAPQRTAPSVPQAPRSAPAPAPRSTPSAPPAGGGGSRSGGGGRR